MKKGFTLVEVIIGFVVLAVATAAVTVVFNSNITNWEQARLSVEKNQSIRKTLDKMFDDIAMGTKGILSPTEISVGFYNKDCDMVTYTYDAAQHALKRDYVILNPPESGSQNILTNVNSFDLKYYDSNKARLAGAIDPAKIAFITIWMRVGLNDFATTIRAPKVTGGGQGITGGPFSILSTGRYATIAGNKLFMADSAAVSFGATCGAGGGDIAPTHLAFCSDRSFWGLSHIQKGSATLDQLIKFDKLGTPGTPIDPPSLLAGTVLNLLSVNKSDGSCWISYQTADGYVLSRYASNGAVLQDRLLLGNLTTTTGGTSPYQPYASSVVISNIEAAPDGSVYGIAYVPGGTTVVPHLFQVQANARIRTGSISNTGAGQMGLAIDTLYGSREGKPSPYLIWLIPYDVSSWRIYRYESINLNNSLLPVTAPIPGESVYYMKAAADGSVWTWGVSPYPIGPTSKAVLHKFSKTGALQNIGPFSKTWLVAPYGGAADFSTTIFTNPISVDPSGNLYVADYSGKVWAYNSSGIAVPGNSFTAPFSVDTVETLKP